MVEILFKESRLLLSETWTEVVATGASTWADGTKVPSLNLFLCLGKKNMSKKQQNQSQGRKWKGLQVK